MSTMDVGEPEFVDVFTSEDNWMFSSAVHRDFGENKHVRLNNGSFVLSSVHPLKCDPVECGLKKVGTIKV